MESTQSREVFVKANCIFLMGYNHNSTPYIAIGPLSELEAVQKKCIYFAQF